MLLISDSCRGCEQKSSQFHRQTVVSFLHYFNQKTDDKMPSLSPVDWSEFNVWYHDVHKYQHREIRRAQTPQSRVKETMMRGTEHFFKFAGLQKDSKSSFAASSSTLSLDSLDLAGICPPILINSGSKTEPRKRAQTYSGTESEGLKQRWQNHRLSKKTKNSGIYRAYAQFAAGAVGKNHDYI